jgi:hypothetical protein
VTALPLSLARRSRLSDGGTRRLSFGCHRDAPLEKYGVPMDNEQFEVFLDAWCEKNLPNFGREIDAQKLARRADSLWDEAHEKQFGTEITMLRNATEGGLVGWVSRRYEAAEFRHKYSDDLAW